MRVSSENIRPSGLFLLSFEFGFDSFNVHVLDFRLAEKILDTSHPIVGRSFVFPSLTFQFRYSHGSCLVFVKEPQK